MRRLASLAVAASVMSFRQLAIAADMPTKAPRAPAVIPYSWTGFYVGANVGYTWGPWDASASQIIFDPSTTHDAKVNGVLGGLSQKVLRSGARTRRHHCAVALTFGRLSFLS
jgi:outer membrane immunogenic protein